MKNFIFLCVSIAVVFVFFISCEKGAIECETPVAFQEIDFSKYPKIQVLDQEYEDVFFVINTQEDFNRKIIKEFNDEDLNIDFENYTLLIGKKVTSGVPANLVAQSVFLNCDSTKLTYNVTIKNGSYTALGNFIYGVLIPKSSAQALLNINIHN